MKTYLKDIKANYDLALDEFKKDKKSGGSKSTKSITSNYKEAQMILNIAVRANASGMTREEIQLLAKNI